MWRNFYSMLVVGFLTAWTIPNSAFTSLMHRYHSLSDPDQ